MTEAKDAMEPIDSGAAICTLFEGDYHFGLAAFLNSLVRAGFAGTVWVGYRGALPPWLGQLSRADGAEDRYLLADQVRVVFLRLQTKIHLTNYKPQFMLDLLAGHAHDAQYLWYFDPDIWLQASWSFFANWQRHGIALCQEVVDNILPHNCPLRHKWMEIGEALDLGEPQQLNHYYNGGMVGIPSAQASFLEMWKRLIAYAEAMGCDLRRFERANREHPFHMNDQDSLNIATMYARHPLTTLGPQGMGFVSGNAAMCHATGDKPWRGSFVLRALQGFPPTHTAKAFLLQVGSPIRPYSPWRLRAKRLACATAALIGRFYRRN